MRTPSTLAMACPQTQSPTTPCAPTSRVSILFLICEFSYIILGFCFCILSVIAMCLEQKMNQNMSSFSTKMGNLPQAFPLNPESLLDSFPLFRSQAPLNSLEHFRLGSAPAILLIFIEVTSDLIAQSHRTFQILRSWTIFNYPSWHCLPWHSLFSGPGDTPASQFSSHLSGSAFSSNFTGGASISFPFYVDIPTGSSLSPLVSVLHKSFRQYLPFFMTSTYSYFMASKSVSLGLSFGFIYPILYWLFSLNFPWGLQTQLDQNWTHQPLLNHLKKKKKSLSWWHYHLSMTKT